MATEITSTNFLKRNTMAEEKAVKGNDVVTIYATDKSKFKAPGTPMTVHKVQAEKLIAKGVATETAPKKK